MRSLVYIHIGKTGGTALRKTLAAAGVSCSQPFVQSHMTEAEAAPLRQYDVICGHISRNDAKRWFPERKIITTLREPIDRCLSFIHYIRGLTVTPHSPPAVVDAHRMPILDLLETWQVRQNVHNTMVRQLGGHMLDEPPDLDGLLEWAKVTLIGSVWVGFHDTLSADIERLSVIVDAPLQEVVDNVTPCRPSIAEEDPRVIDRLQELNAADLALWHWAKRSLFQSAAYVETKWPPVAHHAIR